MKGSGVDGGRGRGSADRGVWEQILCMPTRARTAISVQLLGRPRSTALLSRAFSGSHGRSPTRTRFIRLRASGSSCRVLLGARPHVCVHGQTTRQQQKASRCVNETLENCVACQQPHVSLLTLVAVIALTCIVVFTHVTAYTAAAVCTFHFLRPRRSSSPHSRINLATVIIIIVIIITNIIIIIIIIIITTTTTTTTTIIIIIHNKNDIISIIIIILITISSHLLLQRSARGAYAPQIACQCHNQRALAGAPVRGRCEGCGGARGEKGRGVGAVTVAGNLHCSSRCISESLKPSKDAIWG